MGICLTRTIILGVLESFLLNFFNFLVHRLITFPQELSELRLVVNVGLFASDGTVESFGLGVAHSWFDAFDGFSLALHVVVLVYEL